MAGAFVMPSKPITDAMTNKIRARNAPKKHGKKEVLPPILRLTEAKN